MNFVTDLGMKKLLYYDPLTNQLLSEVGNTNFGVEGFDLATNFGLCAFAG